MLPEAEGEQELNAVVSEKDRYKDKGGKRNPSPPKPRVSVIVRVFRELKRRIDRYHSQAQQAESEHVVNERIMARWTRVVGIFTIFMTVASIISAVTSYFALVEVASSSKQTNRMIDASIQQAEAVSGQMALMKKQYELSIIQIRANIRKNGIKGEANFDSSGKKLGWSFNAVFSNVGGTDAVDVRHWWMWKSIEGKYVPGRGCPIDYKKNLDGPSFVIPPGQPIQQSALRIPIDEVLAASKGEKSIFLVGRIQYRDVFPDTPNHFYNWCIKLVPNNIDANEFSPFNVDEEKE